MKISTLLAASLLGAGVFASSDEQLSPQEREIAKRAGFIATTGVSGATAPRLEIRTMAKNTALWNLYLLAMQKFQAMPQSDPMSYYQIAGASSIFATTTLIQKLFLTCSFRRYPRTTLR